MVALSVKYAAEERNSSMDDRYAVTLQLDFYFKENAETFAKKPLSHKVSESQFETVVFVRNKVTFQECVAWKFNDTKKKWDDRRAFLESE